MNLAFIAQKMQDRSSLSIGDIRSVVQNFVEKLKEQLLKSMTMGQYFPRLIFNVPRQVYIRIHKAKTPKKPFCFLLPSQFPVIIHETVPPDRVVGKDECVLPAPLPLFSYTPPYGFSVIYHIFSVYLHVGNPIHPQNSPNLPFLFFSGCPHTGQFFISIFRPVVPSSSFASFSKTCWFMRQSFNARCAPAVEIP